MTEMPYLVALATLVFLVAFRAGMLMTQAYGRRQWQAGYGAGYDDAYHNRPPKSEPPF